MGKRRYLAPWGCEVLPQARRPGSILASGGLGSASGLSSVPSPPTSLPVPPASSAVSAASGKAASGAPAVSCSSAGLDPAPFLGKPALYHCISRVNERKFLLGQPEREQFVRFLRTYEAFCQVRVLTFCVLSNHFHILVEIPRRPAQDPSDEELLHHLKTLYSGRQLAEIRWQLEHFRKQSNHRGAEQLRQRFLARMWDLSAFMHGLKRRFAQWYNRLNQREGHLWSDRFKSVLVEDGHAARVMAAYIDLNPVRAGICKDPADYRWSGYGEAVVGKAMAREGLRRVMVEHYRSTRCDALAVGKTVNWQEVAADYRRMLAGDLERKTGKNTGKLPVSPLEAAGKTTAKATRGRPPLAEFSEGDLLRCRVRYFTDGVVLGTREFVEAAFRLTKQWFGPRRRTGARRLARADTELRTMRDLRTGIHAP